MADFRHEDEEFIQGHDISVDAHPDDYAWNYWTVYPKSAYEVGEYEGRKYLYVADDDETGKWFTDRRLYKPLSRQYTILFLELARWPEECGMDKKKPLGSSKNEVAALEWAATYGVLGLSNPSPFTVHSDANRVIRHSLGIWGAVRPRIRNEAMGGLEDTVESFAREAWIANTALRLYEAATSPGGPDMNALEEYMPDRNGSEGMNIPSTKDLFSAAPTAARDWALHIVSDIVEDKMRGHVWPVPVRDGIGVGHSRGWAFDSLLGAMWLQMSWLMSGNAKRCEWCGKLLNIDLEWAMRLPKAPQTDRATLPAANLARDAEDFARLNPPPRKPRSDRRFCKNGGRCKAAWNYHHGVGKSGKAARKKRREDENS